VGLTLPNYSGSCVGGSVVIGGAFDANEVKGDDPDGKRYAGPPGWGWGWG